MLNSMKVISYGFTVEYRGSITGIFGFLGYMYSPSNLIFGPWITYSEYIDALRKHYRLNMVSLICHIGDICMYSIGFLYLFFFQGLLWIKKLVWIFIKCSIFLSLSNCIVPLFVFDKLKSSWLNAYVSALTFRTSHYFIISLSELTMVCSGFVDIKNVNAYRKNNIFTKPADIEYPDSMVSVVRKWNYSVHRFLKICKY